MTAVTSAPSSCVCGHVERMHPGSDCRACTCDSYTQAADAAAAIMAGAGRKRAAIVTARAQRNEARR